MNHKVAVIGAGASGRGFIGRLLMADGAEVTYIDSNLALVKKLRQNGCYTVYMGRERTPCVVSGYNVFHVDDDEAVEAISMVEFVFISVGISNFASLRPLFQKVAKVNPSPRIIVCENGISPKITLREKLTGIGNPQITQGVIFCTTIPVEEINAISEDYPDLPYDVDEDLFKLPFHHFTATKEFSALLQRKIYTYNCISACIAYCGHVLGYTDYGLAATDQYVAILCRKLAGQLTRVLVKEYAIDEHIQREFAENAIRKFTDTTIADTIQKNARAVMRKLAPEERVMGPMRLFLKFKESTDILEIIVACAYRYLVDKEMNLLKDAGYSTPAEFFKRINPDLPERIYRGINERFALLSTPKGIERVLQI